MDELDAFDLRRFVDAQAPVFAQARAELAAGRKTSHWMWFVFPQLRGLGRSETARFYGVSGRDEAFAYWRHPVLGTRLANCVGLLLGLDGRSAREIFGSVDELKLRSCLTLFAQVAPEEPRFQQALDRYFAGEPDPRTIELIAG